MLPFRQTELAEQIERVVHPDDKGAPLDVLDLSEEQDAYAVSLAGLLTNDEHLNDTVSALSAVLLSGNVVPPTDNTGIVSVWRDSGNNQQRFVAPEYYVTSDPDTPGHQNNIEFPDGETVGVYIVGRQYIDSGATASTAALGAHYAITNAGGVLSSELLGVMFEVDTVFSTIAYSSLTQTPQADATPADSGARIDDITLFFSDTAGAPVNLNDLHDPVPQDQAIADNAARIAVLEAGVGGVTAVQLADAKAAVEAAQAIRDQAQDDAAAAEESEDDTENTAQDALIAANDQLAKANAALAAANEARIQMLESALRVVDWEPGITVTDLQIVIAPRPADGALTAYRLLSENSPHTAGAVFAPNLYEEIGPASDVLDGFDNRIVGGLSSQWTVNPTNGVVNWMIEGRTQLSLTRRATGATSMILQEGTNGEQAIFRMGVNNFLLGIEPNPAQTETWNLRLPAARAPGIGYAMRSASDTNPTQTEWVQVYDVAEADAITDSLAADIVALDATHATTVQTLNGLVASFATEQTNTAAQFTAFDTRIQALEGFDPTALVADIASNMADITANDGELMTLMTQVSQNATAQQANANAITTNANALAQESTDRAQADAALQQDIDTRDQQNVKLTGDQDIEGDKNFTSGDTRFTSLSSAPGAIRMMFGNAIAGLIRYATGDLQITHFTTAGAPGARLLLSELFGQFNRRMEFAQDIDAQASVNLFDQNDRRVSLRVPNLTGDYNLILPADPPLAGQVLAISPTNAQQGIWQYPPGFGYTIVKPDENTNTINDITVPEAQVASIDTTGFVPGLWEIEVIGLWSVNIGNSNYFGGIFDEDNLSNANNGFDVAVDSAFLSAEPQDSAGIDLDGGAAGTDQLHPFPLKATVQIVAGDNKTYSYRHRPQAAGIQATARIKFIMKRVSD